MLEPCNPDIYTNGTQVFLTHTLSSLQLEDWVKTLREESGQPIDWHWAAGRAIILTLGDLEKVKKAIKDKRYVHDEYYLERIKELGLTRPTGLEGIWNYNGF